jgi:hypothetical protein
MPKSVESGSLGVKKIPRVLDVRRHSCAMQGHGRRESRAERARAGPRGIIFTADTHALSLLCCPRRGQGGIDFHARHIISDLESKQVADPDLSLECVRGKLFNDRDAEFR